MASKKSSQAQPIRHPATIRSAARITCVDGSVPAIDKARETDVLPAVSAPNPTHHNDLQPPNQHFMFQCPAWPLPNQDILDEVNALLSSGDWAKYQPAVLERLRSKIADFLSCRHVRLVPSGSAAMELALRAAALATPPGNAATLPAGPPEVICPAFDYPGNARAIRLVGALPVLVDNAESGWTIDPTAVTNAATTNTVAVIASHLYGEIAAVAELRQICDRHGWLLIEDVCQMPGGRIGDKPLGSFGHIATWSFGGSKPLTAGCGGAVTTDDDRVAQRLATYADRPSDAYPLSPLQAAALLPQWSSLAQLTVSQNQSLTRLRSILADTTPAWSLPKQVGSGHCPVFYKIPIVIAAKWIAAGITPTQIIDHANSLGIPAGLPFRLPGRLAPSRGRIDSLIHAQELAARTWLVDHRVLAADESGIDQLAAAMMHLYQWFDCQAGSQANGD